MSDNFEMTLSIAEIAVVDAPGVIRKLRALVEYERGENRLLRDRLKVALSSSGDERLA